MYKYNNINMHKIYENQLKIYIIKVIIKHAILIVKVNGKSEPTAFALRKP